MMHTVVGIITNARQEILISERPLHKSFGGLWEFPGGKVEPNEDPLAALKRELKEELGIEVRSANPFWQGYHHYPEYTVLLDVWQVLQFSKDPVGLEGQKIQWVTFQKLNQYPFLSGNQDIINYWVSFNNSLINKE